MDTPSYREVTMTIACSPGSGYGFEIDGTRRPLQISAVSKDSSSADAGLLKDDLLLMVNGHSIKEAPLGQVQSIISYGMGTPLTVKVARLITEQKTKTKIPPISEKSGLLAYQDAVGDAVRSAQDALDLLGPLSIPAVQRSEEEVAINLEKGDSDQSSPPVSSPERSDEEYDPLMDFSKGIDQYTYDSKGHVSAVMVGGVIRTQQALQGIKNISELIKKQPDKNKPLVSSEATFEPTGSHILLLKESDSTPELKVEKSPDTSRHSESPIPPPVPPYNPISPDRFLLSNRPEYQLEVKRQYHSYEDIELNEKSQQPPSESFVSKVPLRNKEKPAAKPVDSTPPLLLTADHLTAAEPSSKQRSFTPAAGPSVSLDPIRASRGLPGSVHSWKIDHVSQWLQQLSSSLNELYSQCFTSHSITGHTLLHLNQSKLQSMGVTSREHRMQLAMAIARLRLHHEQRELERLSSQVSWL